MPTRLDPSKFDPSKPLAMGRFNTVGGFALAVGTALKIVDDPKERGEVTLDTATRLWSSGTFVYAEDARPTPVESREDAARRLVVMEPLDGGWYLIRAPWLGEGEKVQGEAAATTRRDELIEAGVPEGFTGVTDVTAETTAETDDSAGGENGPSEEERVKALVDGNDGPGLRDMITEIDKARAAADPPLDPLGAKSDHNKTDLARLIVGVDGDIGPGTGGTQ